MDKDEEAKVVARKELLRDALTEMFDALPESKKMQFVGHYNELLLFISKATEDHSS